MNLRPYFNIRWLLIIGFCILIFSCKEKREKMHYGLRFRSNPEVILKDTILMKGDSLHAQIYLSLYPKSLLRSITVDSISRDSIKPNMKNVVAFKLPIKDGIGYFNYLPNKE